MENSVPATQDISNKMVNVCQELVLLNVVRIKLDEELSASARRVSSKYQENAAVPLTLQLKTENANATQAIPLKMKFARKINQQDALPFLSRSEISVSALMHTT